ncbi:hypothetical protein SAMN05421765_0035 [Kaistella antarctica]|uniref:Uncharacterized protein n=1 Tax=Kaistella antarctica TaxID=266748 RepID=A0A3S4UMN4_9FLAO|nr:hypothetical protein SAMN05421765_0035 [Kaistella antarctica]VEH99909.1 Uncharacterised protein [Kaistella antarctica]
MIILEIADLLFVKISNKQYRSSGFFNAKTQRFTRDLMLKLRAQRRFT